MTFKVLVTDKINDIAVKILEETCEVDYKTSVSPEELKEIIKNYDGIMIRSASRVTKEVIDLADRLKVVGRAGVGVDNVDLDAATNKGIVVINSPEGNTIAAAEHAVAMMLSMARHIPAADASTKGGKWERSKFLGSEVFNKTLGVIGLGKIGSWVAKIAKSMGMKVVIYDPFVSEAKVKEMGAKYAASLDELWPVADFITLHVPKNRETVHLINKNTLNRMKKGVRIINCARGGIIDEAALAEAIQEGQVASAAIDVFEQEPIVDSPLLGLGDKVVLTPHLGASTEEAQVNVAVDVAEQIRDMARGDSARSAVNIPTLKPEILDPVKHYMQLAENLGSLVRQLTSGATKNVEVIACGSLAEKKIGPLTIAVTKGILGNSVEGVNYVNAPILCKQRGIHIQETKSTDAGSYVDVLKVVLTTEKEQKVVSGTMLADDLPRILRVNEYYTNVEPGTHMLILPHENKPAMVAQVATILGREKVNISMMQVGKMSRGEQQKSLMVLNVDDPVSNSTLEELKGIDGIYSAKYVNLRAV